jgi:hypothetical protein
MIKTRKIPLGTPYSYEIVGLKIDLDKSIGHVKTKNRVYMKALLSGQLLTSFIGY